MTAAELRAKREDFWDTAPTFDGRREIWQALRAACETTDLAMAQAILSSANISLPGGMFLCGFAWFGLLFDLLPCVDWFASLLRFVWFVVWFGLVRCFALCVDAVTCHSSPSNSISFFVFGLGLRRLSQRCPHRRLRRDRK